MYGPCVMGPTPGENEGSLGIVLPAPAFPGYVVLNPTPRTPGP